MVTYSAVGPMRRASAIGLVLTILAAGSAISCGDGADPIAPGFDAGFQRPEPRLGLADSILALNWNDIRLATGQPECTGATDYPHKSTHVPGTVNVVARTECTDEVPYIQVAVSLHFRSDTTGTWSQVASAGAFSAAGESTIQANAPDSCQTGYYYASSRHWVKYPGESDTTELFPTQSPVVQVTC